MRLRDLDPAAWKAISDQLAEIADEIGFVPDPDVPLADYPEVVGQETPDGSVGQRCWDQIQQASMSALFASASPHTRITELASALGVEARTRPESAPERVDLRVGDYYLREQSRWAESTVLRIFKDGEPLPILPPIIVGPYGTSVRYEEIEHPDLIELVGLAFDRAATILREAREEAS